MAEADIQVLLEMLKGLKADILDLKADIKTGNTAQVAALERITKTENDISDLYQKNSEVRLSQKQCKEEEGVKIETLQNSITPAVETQKEIGKFKEFVLKHWVKVAWLVVGILAAKYPEFAKLVASVKTVTP